MTNQMILLDPPVTEQEPEAPARELNAMDRCDACGSRAYVEATLPTGTLLFCGHHATKYEPTLGEKYTLDTRDELVASVKAQKGC